MKKEFKVLQVLKLLPLLAGLLTEIQCKSKRLRKNTKASPGQSTGDETEAADNTDSKHVTSTTKLLKVVTTRALEMCSFPHSLDSTIVLI